MYKKLDLKKILNNKLNKFEHFFQQFCNKSFSILNLFNHLCAKLIIIYQWNVMKLFYIH